jgi:hypothetical protein
MSEGEIRERRGRPRISLHSSGLHSPTGICGRLHLVLDMDNGETPYI